MYKLYSPFVRHALPSSYCVHCPRLAHSKPPRYLRHTIAKLSYGLIAKYTRGLRFRFFQDDLGVRQMAYAFEQVTGFWKRRLPVAGCGLQWRKALQKDEMRVKPGLRPYEWEAQRVIWCKSIDLWRWKHGGTSRQPALSLQDSGACR
jgi:hypothetical protein